MATEALYKFIHVMIAVTFSGLLLANYYYLVRSYRSGDVSLFKYSLRFTCYNDIALLLLIVVVFFTGTKMVEYSPFSFSTSWVQAAFILFGLTSLGWFMLMIIKWINLRTVSAAFRFYRLYHCISMIMFVFIVLIIHDAVMHQTFLFGVS